MNSCPVLVSELMRFCADNEHRNSLYCLLLFEQAPGARVRAYTIHCCVARTCRPNALLDLFFFLTYCVPVSVVAHVYVLISAGTRFNVTVST